jgi:hypothetical protein
MRGWNHSTWRPDTEAKDEDGSSSPKVRFILFLIHREGCHSLYFIELNYCSRTSNLRRFFELFEKYGGTPENNVKLKKPKQLQEVLDIARFLLYEVKGSESEEREIEEKRGKLDQLKSVLEM